MAKWKRDEEKRKKLEELQGQIIEFIFQNDVNSYTIAVVETNEGEEITVTGYLPFINIGNLQERTSSGGCKMTAMVHYNEWRTSYVPWNTSVHRPEFFR